MSSNKNLLLLLERPNEPVFMPKGDIGTVFDVPNNYLSDRYRPIGTEIASRFGDENERVVVKNITVPDFRVPMKLGRRDHFSLWIPAHREYAGKLIDTFMGKLWLSI
jgi:tyrosinase